MKNTLLLLLFVVASASAQEAVTHSKVIQVDSIGKDKLFALVNEWFAVTYNSSKDVIQMADKQEGTIVGKGIMNYQHAQKMYTCYNGRLEYTIKAYVKDNRFKVELTKFNHISDGACSLGLITSAEIHSESGMNKKYNNIAWNDIKVKIEEYSNKIFNSLESKVRETKSSEW